MREEYGYRVYGLDILSEIECKELVRLKHSPLEYDVEIRIGSVNDEIKEKISLGHHSFYTNEDMWFHVDHIATYWIQNGKKVTIELCQGSDIPMAKQYLLGSCLGMIMLQRDMIAIHGGTIVFDGKGIIFTGLRGAGKSTLTSALRKVGYQFIADDVSSVEVSNPHMIHPSFPQQKLCKDAAIALGYDLEQYQTLMGDTQMKYLIPAHDAFLEEKVPLRAIVELQEDADIQGIEIETLVGQERLMAIYRNIYRIEMKQIAGVNPDYFKKCIALAKDIPVYRIKRQKDVLTIDLQIAWLEEEFLNKDMLLEA